MKGFYKICLFIFLAAATIAMPINVLASGTGGSDVRVIHNGYEMQFEQPPIIANDRVMVPFRAIFEALGATVTWNAERQRVTATYHYPLFTEIVLTIGSDTAYVNGVSHSLDASPFIARDTRRTLVPLRFVSEASGADVQWNYDTRTVTISSLATPSLIAPASQITVQENYEHVIWEDAFYWGSGLLDPEDFEDHGDWHPTHRNQIIGDSYFNGQGWRISESSYREMIAERDRILAQIITPGMSEFDQLRAAHRWLVENVSYNNDVWSWERFNRTGDGWNPNWRNLYSRYEFEHQVAWSAFVLRTTVCAGYADALLYLLEPLGIASYYIYGPVLFPGAGEFNHAWNLVQLGGAWFHIDATWNRMYTSGQPGVGRPIVNYEWFLISDNSVRTRGTSSRSWDTSAFPRAPRDFVWDRPEFMWDHNTRQWRHRTADDDRLFSISATLSHTEAGNLVINPRSARPGEWVSIDVHPNQGFTFSHWEIVSGNVNFDLQVGTWARFLMPTGNVSLRAVFNHNQNHDHNQNHENNQNQNQQNNQNQNQNQNQQNQTFSVTVSVNNPQAGTATVGMPGQAQLTIPVGEWAGAHAQANSGFEFSHWEVVSGNVNLSVTNFGTTDSNASFTMPAQNISLRAVFTQLQAPQVFSVAVSANNNNAGAVTANPSANILPNTQVFLQAHPHISEGFYFSHWEILAGNVSMDIHSNSTQFTMPAENVSVRAVFGEMARTFNVTVTTQGGGSANASPDQNLLVNQTVNLFAAQYQGHEFSHWEVVYGNVSLHSTESWSSFNMPTHDVHIRAHFRELMPVDNTVSNE